MKKAKPQLVLLSFHFAPSHHVEAEIETLIERCLSRGIVVNRWHGIDPSQIFTEAERRRRHSRSVKKGLRIATLNGKVLGHPPLNRKKWKPRITRLRNKHVSWRGIEAELERVYGEGAPSAKTCRKIFHGHKPGKEKVIQINRKREEEITWLRKAKAATIGARKLSRDQGA